MLKLQAIYNVIIIQDSDKEQAMMENNITAKSAIECLKKHKEERKHDFIVLMGAADKAIEALEKQIPKEPVIREELYHCPRCSGGGSTIYGDQYCCECGQALDWSEEE